MIQAELYFTNGIDSNYLVNSLQLLQESIRPVYFAEDESKIFKDNVLSNKIKFDKFRERNKTGFFLYAENKTLFDISIQHTSCVEITLYLKDSLTSYLTVEFFKSLANYRPIFGFACHYKEPVPDANGSYVISSLDDICSEYDHRNRHYIKIGKNNIESWIGRKLEKYIPGVYWLTLFSDELLTLHNVNISDLLVEAIGTESLGDSSLHLLKFFERPENWKDNAERLDNLCERVNGVFSRRSVEAAVQGVNSYLDYDEVIANWR